MQTKPLLRINALSAEIGGQGILQDISITMRPGEWLGVVGGSGAGKSTLLRVIMGLKKPAQPIAGEMYFDGQCHDLRAARMARPDGIAYVPQSPAHGLDPLRRLDWQWKQLVRCKSCDNRDLLQALGLPDTDGQFPHEWSLGMQQRLLLAMALMEEPKLLILDEPTSALDALIAAQVLREVERLAQDKGVAVLMVTHDLALAARFSDQIVVMARGHVLENGPSNQVLAAPTTGYAQELVAHKTWKRAEHA